MTELLRIHEVLVMQSIGIGSGSFLFLRVGGCGGGGCGGSDGYHFDGPTLLVWFPTIDDGIYLTKGPGPEEGTNGVVGLDGQTHERIGRRLERRFTHLDVLLFSSGHHFE